MKETTTLNKLLESTSKKKIFLLGREGIFTNKEINRFFKQYNTKIVLDYENNISAIIEHNILNPFEEDISNLAYENGTTTYKLKELEKLISKSINDDELLMGIKLANDSSRIFRLLGNIHINNSLFVKLLSLYEWDDEDEDSREDRDVIMYTLRRYIKIKPNEEDLLYSYLTLRRLATEAEDSELLLALIRFPNFEFMVRGKEKITLRETVARNKNINDKVISKLIFLKDSKVNISLASNSNIPSSVLEKFLLKNDKNINKSLATNSNIDNAIFNELLYKDTNVIELLLIWQEIDLERLRHVEQKKFNDELFSILGANEKLTKECIQKLLKLSNIQLLINICQNSIVEPKELEKIYTIGRGETFANLAINPSTPTLLLQELYEKNIDNIEMLSALAHNKNLPQNLLKSLYDKDSFTINKGLSTNPSLPIELLDNLKIDTRLQNYLAQNPIFIEEYESILDFDGRGI